MCEEMLPWVAWVVVVNALTAEQLIERYGIEYLKSGSLFGALSDAAICDLVNKGEVKSLAASDPLFKYGDPVDGFFIVIDGMIRLTKLDEQGLRYHRDITFGNEVGYVSLVSLRPRAGSVEAVEDSVLLKITSHQLYEFQHNFPTDFDILLLNLARQMARRIHDSSV